MDFSEKIALLGSVFLLSLFLVGLTYVDKVVDLKIPTCVTEVKPFNEGKFLYKGENHYELHIVASMWKFEPSEIELPPNSNVDIYLTSRDVTHGFQIVNTNVNLMAVPGTVNYARVSLRKEGNYPIVCHEFCGVGHQQMTGLIKVSNSAPKVPVVASQNIPNKELLTTKGCIACHSTDGTAGVGPTFKGILGRKETLQDGSVITIDEAHLIESIKNPTAKVVKGFQPLMPTLPMSEEELKQIVKVLENL